MRVDAHQQVLNHGRFEYPPLPPQLNQDYLPEHVARILKRNRFDGLIVVALTESPGETRWLLEQAEQNETIMAVVGGPASPSLLDEWQRFPKLRGVRLSPHAVTRDNVQELAARGLVCEIPAEAGDLQPIAHAAAQAPNLHVVIEHLGKPDPRADSIEPWLKGMEQLAQIPGVYVKLSGLLTLATPPPTPEELRPLIHHLMRTFGPDRLMFGSDWPFCLTVADLWKATLALFTQALGAQSIEVRSKLLGDTAHACYRLG